MQNRDKCSHSSTTNITRLDPIIYCIVIYDQKLDKSHKIKEYVGDDCIRHFVRSLEKLEVQLTDLINEELPLNKNTIPENFNPVNVKECCVCLEPFSNPGQQIIDHCQHNGYFCSVSCYRCNLQMQERYKCDVYIHNLIGFDLNLIIAQYVSVNKT